MIFLIRYYNVIVTLFLSILSLCLFRYPSEKTAAGKNHIYKGSVGHPRKLIHQDKISRYIHEGRSCLENKPTRVTCSGKSNGIILFSYSMNHDAERNSPHLIFNDRQMSSVSHFFFFFLHPMEVLPNHLVYCYTWIYTFELHFGQARSIQIIPALACLKELQSQYRLNPRASRAHSNTLMETQKSVINSLNI